MLPATSPVPLDARAAALWRALQRFFRNGTNAASVTAAVTLTGNDGLMLGDATAGAFAVTLPLAVDARGVTYWIKKVDASANAVTVTAAGADTIDGAATYPLTVQYQAVAVRSDGAAWWVV